MEDRREINASKIKTWSESSHRLEAYKYGANKSQAPRCRAKARALDFIETQVIHQTARDNPRIAVETGAS